MLKIYDCFLFWKEFNALEIRLNELYDVVDRFIIVEFSQSHRGNKKEFYLKENFNRFESFSDKVSLFSLKTEFSPKRSPLFIAHQQRLLLDNLINDHKPKIEDLIITSDSDEIIRSQLLEEIKQTKLKEIDFFFNLNLYQNKLNNFIGTWLRPRIKNFGNYVGFSNSYRDNWIELNYEYRRLKLLPFMRVNKFFSADLFDTKIGKWVGFQKPKAHIFDKAGWHFSKIYDVQTHLEHAQNTPHDINRNKSFKSNLENRIILNQTSYGKLAQGTIVPIDESFPAYVRANKDRFSEYIENVIN